MLIKAFFSKKDQSLFMVFTCLECCTSGCPVTKFYSSLEVCLQPPFILRSLLLISQSLAFLLLNSCPNEYFFQWILIAFDLTIIISFTILHFDKSFLWIISLKLQRKYVERSSNLPRITRLITCAVPKQPLNVRLHGVVWYWGGSKLIKYVSWSLGTG